MAKNTCPECGHRHTVKGQIKTIGVRSRRITGNQFEYSISMPSSIADGDTRLITVTDDLILSGAFGLAFGGLCGFCAGLIAPDYAIEFIGIGASAGLTLAWGWLCSEHNQRLKRVLPWFLEQKAKWPRVGGVPVNGGEVTLTVDHRYRDSYSEEGRTIALLGVLSVDVDRFFEWAQGAIRGDSLAIAHWTGSGKLFSRNEYDDMLNKMRQANIVYNAPGNKGNVLTGAGRHTLRAIISHHSPTPQMERMQC